MRGVVIVERPSRSLEPIYGFAWSSSSDQSLGDIGRTPSELVGWEIYRAGRRRMRTRLPTSLSTRWGTFVATAISASVAFSCRDSNMNAIGATSYGAVRNQRPRPRARDRRNSSDKGGQLSG